MKEILINEVCLYFDPGEIRKAETDSDMIGCLKDAKGNPVFSPMRARAMAKDPKWEKIASTMKEESHEGGRDQKKSGQGRRKTEKP